MTNKETYDLLKITSNFDKYGNYKDHRFLNFDKNIYDMEESIRYIKKIYNYLGKQADNKTIGQILSFEYDWDNPLLAKTLYNVLKFSKCNDIVKYKYLHKNLLKVITRGYVEDAEDFIYTISDISKNIIENGDYSKEFDKATSNKLTKIVYLADKNDCVILMKSKSNNYRLVSCKNGTINRDRNIVGDEFMYYYDYEKISKIVNIQSLDLLFF